MKNKKRNVMISFVVGVVMLSTAAFANYSNANGYTVYKEALKKLVKEENYTMNAKMSILFDSTPMYTSTVVEKYDKNGDVKLNQTTKDTSFAIDHESTYGNYYQDGMNIRSYKSDENNDSSGESGKTYHVDDVNKDNNPYRTFNIGYDNDDENKERIDKMVFFAEKVADMVVGDLKNNFIYLSDENGVYNYTMQLDTFQIPEIVGAGLDVAFSNIRQQSRNIADMDEDREEYYLLQLGDSPEVEGANCRVSVDEEGRIVSNKLDATLLGKDENGKPHRLKVEIELNMSEYGTTIPERLDLDKLPNVRYYSESDKNEAEITKDVTGVITVVD